MPEKSEVFEVIKYVYLKFSEDWKSELLPHAVMKYNPIDGDSRLKVVAEGDAGLWTYEFLVREDQSVYVIGELVHVPAQYKIKRNANTF